MNNSKKRQKGKSLQPVKCSEEEWQKESKRLNSYSKEDVENLIEWLRDAEQIPKEGESIDDFIKRTGWTLEEENKIRKWDGLPLLKNEEEYRRLLEDKQK